MPMMRDELLAELLTRLTALCDLPDGPQKCAEQRHEIYVLRNELAVVVHGSAATLTQAGKVLSGKG